MTLLRDAVGTMQFVTLFVALVTATVATLVLLDVLSGFALGMVIVIAGLVILAQVVSTVRELTAT